MSQPITAHVANAGALAVCATSPEHFITVAVGIGALCYYATYLYDWIAKRRKKNVAPPKAD